MAKKVIHNHNREVVAIRDTDPAPVPDQQAEVTAAPSAGTPPAREFPEYIDRILRAFPNYPELYIDFQGGTYTVDTPPVFRSNATLYKNPHHKP